MTRDQILSAASIVVNAERHFADLKAQANALLSKFEGHHRGYLTPSEDEVVRHLLVSYWQSRSALLELILELRDDEPIEPELYSQAFLAAFAAALVLIDAARFLRERFHDQPVLRAKLNEPEPIFGIPAWSYETVQASLTKPLHAWRLYQALRYFRAHEQQLKAISADERSAALVEIIDRHLDRLEIGFRSYAAVRVRVKTRFAWNSLKRDLLHRALFGLQRLAGNAASEVSLKRNYCPRLPEAVVGQLRSILQPGDVLITRKEYAFTNYFLPGFWPHAALYLGDCTELEALGVASHASAIPRWQRLLSLDPTEPKRVLEALKDGVRLRSFDSPCSSDAMVVLRPLLARQQIAEAVCRGLSHEGKDYDFDFDFTRSDRLVCTEVIYRSYDGVGGIQFSLTPRAGRMTLAAEDLIQMALDGRHFETVAVYCPTECQDFLTSRTAAELLQRKREERRPRRSIAPVEGQLS